MTNQENTIIILTETPAHKEERREAHQLEEELQVMVDHPLYHKCAALLELLHSYRFIFILTAIEAVFILGDIFINVLKSAHCKSGMDVSHDGKYNNYNSRARPIDHYRRMSILGIIFTVMYICIGTFNEVNHIWTKILFAKSLDAN
jgi:hypothetical protein